MREVRPGVWHWQSPHPDWGEEEWWPELVSSYAIGLGDDFVLFDPLGVPDELRERATAVVMTAPYHERDARRLGLPAHTPPADTWQDWVEKFGVDPERVRGMESDDLAWLRAGEGEGHFHDPGPWPFGLTAYAGREDNDLKRDDRDIEHNVHSEVAGGRSDGPPVPAGTSTSSAAATAPSTPARRTTSGAGSTPTGAGPARATPARACRWRSSSPSGPATAAPRSAASSP